MKILFLIHVEEMFRDYFPKMYVPRICKAMRSYDDIYVFCSDLDDFRPIREVYNIQNYEQVEWSWGYDPECFNEDEKQFVINANGHEYTWIPEILRDPSYWLNHEIHLGGGSLHECLQDMRDILEYQNIPYQLKRHLTY